MTFIIAEIGINHNGDLNLAKKLIDASKKSGADCVKFQKRVVESSFTKDKLDEPYLTKNSWGKTYGQHKHYLEFTESQFLELVDYSVSIGIKIGCTPCDIPSADFLNSIEDLSFFKIASGDLTNFPLLKHVAQLIMKSQKPLILSTGMSDLNTVKRAVKWIEQWIPQFSILSCTSSYPSEYTDIHLNVIETYKHLFPTHTIGYSGHEIGFIPTLGAIVKGALIIERHITLDKTMRGSDHCGSVEPSEFKEMVDSIYILNQSLGSHTKEIRNSEHSVICKLTKSLCTTRFLQKGHVLSKDDFTCKHSVHERGISPMDYENCIGKTVLVDLNEDTIIMMNHIG